MLLQTFKAYFSFPLFQKTGFIIIFYFQQDHC